MNRWSFEWILYVFKNTARKKIINRLYYVNPFAYQLKRTDVKTVEINDKRTICEVHRLIYDELLEDQIDKAKTIKLLEEAHLMGKNIVGKLIAYNPDEKKKWDVNLDYGETLYKRQKR